MCWSAEVSFATFAVSAVCGLIVRTDSPLYWNFISMQLFEGFMWLDQGCGIVNKTASIAAVVALSLQPLSSLLSSSGMSPPKSALLLYVAAAAFFAYSFHASASSKGGYCARPPEDSRHLSWPFVPHPFSLTNVAWMLMFFWPMIAYFKGTADEVAKLLFNAVVLSLAIYYGKGNGTWGTNWCYFSNVAGVYMVLSHLISGRIKT